MFFVADTAPPATYTLSLHDALPIFGHDPVFSRGGDLLLIRLEASLGLRRLDWIDLARCCSIQSRDRKSTRLNSSHVKISYAVFCLKKKTTTVAKKMCTSMPTLSNPR